MTDFATRLEFWVAKAERAEAEVDRLKAELGMTKGSFNDLLEKWDEARAQVALLREAVMVASRHLMIRKANRLPQAEVNVRDILTNALAATEPPPPPGVTRVPLSPPPGFSGGRKP